MKSTQISLKTSEQVKQFVNIVGKYEYDVDIRSGRYVIDAKSIMGIFSLDLSKPVIVEVYSDKADALLKEIKPFTV